MTVIYALCCPCCDAPRYVGKTKYPRSRLNAHISKAKANQTTHHCSAWIRSLLAVSKRPVFKILETVEDEGWEEAESRWIARYRSEGFDLTNGTGGGDGFHDLPEEILRKRGASRRATLSDPVIRAEFFQRVNAGKATEQAKANRSAAAKAAWADPVRRDAMLAGMRTPEALARRADATRKRMSDPEIAEKHRAGIRERFKNESARRKLRMAGAMRWAKHAGESA